MVVYGYNSHFERKGVFDAGAIVALMQKHGTCQKYSADVAGDEIMLGGDRYAVFVRSRLCVTCGVLGTYFAKERRTKLRKRSVRGGGVVVERILVEVHWHLNLYGVTPQGREVMLTKDHIIPKARGGRDVMFNYQTMCEVCNRAKGDSYEAPQGLDEHWLGTIARGSGAVDQTKGRVSWRMRPGMRILPNGKMQLRRLGEGD